MSVPAFRFAPSPNGELHLGHAYSALVTRDAASRAGGRFLLRFEDIDTSRCRPEFEAAIMADLAWLGLKWEEPVRRQSEHFEDYRKAADRLDALGLLYPCFATRGEIARVVAERQKGSQSWPRDPEGAPIYPGLHRHLDEADRAALRAKGRHHALRLDMDRAAAMAGRLDWTEIDEDGRTTRHRADPAVWGDVVLVRKDVPTSYHLAVVVDDALQGITHVTRGRDLFAATSVHRLLQALLDLPEPVYSHHRLVLDADGRKLSKSRGDTGLRALRESGHSPSDIRTMLGLPTLAG